MQRFSSHGGLFLITFTLGANQRTSSIPKVINCWEFNITDCKPEKNMDNHNQLQTPAAETGVGDLGVIL